MADMTLTDIAQRMRGIDIAMMSTRSPEGTILGRPMSNNGDVDYDGDSYYFSYADTRKVRDIAAEPKVSLAFEGQGGFWAAVDGTATVIRDKSAFAAHWTPDLDQWFEDGVDTDGCVMIHVAAERIHYWQGTDDGEITL